MSLKWATVVIDSAGKGATLIKYRWEGLNVDGRDVIEDDVSDWTDQDIREAAAEIIGAEGDDIKKIEITWD